jgi:hypothetical protein
MEMKMASDIALLPRIEKLERKVRGLEDLERIVRDLEDKVRKLERKA